MSERVNPFGSLDDFQAKSTPKPVERARIDEIAAREGFPSRQAVRVPDAAAPATTRVNNNYTTGRDRQLNTKASAETKDRLVRLAHQLGQPQAQVLEDALKAYEISLNIR